MWQTCGRNKSSYMTMKWQKLPFDTQYPMMKPSRMPQQLDPKFVSIVCIASLLLGYINEYLVLLNKNYTHSKTSYMWSV